MDLSQVAIALLIAFTASLIQSSCGFGYAVFAATTLPFLLPYPQAVALSTMGGGIMSLIVVIRNRGKLRLDVLWPCTLASSVIVVAAVIFSVGKSSAVLTRVLGALLILLSIYFFFFSGKVRVKPTVINGLIFGAISGAGSGFFSIGGPPVVIFLLSALDNKEEYRSTIAVQFICNNIIATTVRLMNGIITPQLMQTAALSVIPIVLGIWAGGYFFRLMSETTLRRVVYAFMAVSGVVMLF